MRKCLACDATDTVSDNVCSACGAEQFHIDLGLKDCGFKASYFADLACFEKKHFWFRARKELVVWSMAEYGKNSSSFLEIGCGTGYILSEIAKAYPHIKLYGSEIFAEGLLFAAARLSGGVELMKIDAHAIPFIDAFDTIGAFDVLEHICEDDLVLNQMHDALRTGGLILLTVPQHKWLWSSVDEYSCHVRRYSANEIHAKLVAAGFEVLRSTSFVSFILPAMLVSRMLKRLVSRGKKNIAAELELSFLMNSIFDAIMQLEISLIRLGMNFPLGGSRLVVARKA